MEDPESKETLVTESPSSSHALTLFGIPLRIKQTPLNMFTLVKIGMIITALQVILSSAIVFMRPQLPYQMRWIPVLATSSIAILYGLMCGNIVSGGWGTASGRFWCDVKIMYARGFNTIRSITNLWTTSLFFIYMALLLNNNHSLIAALLCFSAMVIEWQTGTGENINQYDIKSFERFVDTDGIMCLESLHAFQLQKSDQKTHWLPTILASTARVYICTAIFASGNYTADTHTFKIPLLVLITLYLCIIPIVIEFCYHKHIITFCQVEAYRTISDIIVPTIINAFSLV